MFLVVERFFSVSFSSCVVAVRRLWIVVYRVFGCRLLFLCFCRVCVLLLVVGCCLLVVICWSLLVACSLLLMVFVCRLLYVG